MLKHLVLIGSLELVLIGWRRGVEESKALHRVVVLLGFILLVIKDTGHAPLKVVSITTCHGDVHSLSEPRRDNVASLLILAKALEARAAAAAQVHLS